MKKKKTKEYVITYERLCELDKNPMLIDTEVLQMKKVFDENKNEKIAIHLGEEEGPESITQEKMRVVYMVMQMIYEAYERMFKLPGGDKE